MLQLWGVIDFDVEIHYPHDLSSLPRAYNKKKGKESDQKHIMTSESLLVEVSFVVIVFLNAEPSCY